MNPGFLAEGVLPAYATGKIGANELCVLHESGNILRADPSLPWNILNNDGSVPVTITETVVVEDVVFNAACTTAFSCGHPHRLPCGYFVIPCHPRGSKGVGFRIDSANGAELVSYINVANDTSGAWPEVCPMGGGHFYMIWHVSATIKCALFDKMGVIIGSITTLDTACITSGRVPWHSCVPLGNGHCFIGWGRSTGLVGQIIHGETGALIGSLITLDSKANCGFHCGAPCENGDFLHACWSPNDGYHVIYRYTNEGVRVWGPQRPCAGTSLWTGPDGGLCHPWHNRLFEMPSDNTGHPELNNFCWMLPELRHLSKGTRLCV